MKLVKHTNNNSEQISKYCKRHILRLVIIIEQFFSVLVNNYIEPKVLRLLGFTSSDDIFMNMIITMNWTISHWSRKVLLTNEKNCAEKFTFRDLVKYLKTVQTKSKEKNLNLNQIHKLKEGRDFKEKIWHKSNWLFTGRCWTELFCLRSISSKSCTDLSLMFQWNTKW